MPTFEEWKALQAGQTQAPDADITDKLSSLLGRGAMSAYRTVEPVLDILGRPQTAISEAVGAYRAGDENELLAGLRGLLEGYKAAKYPTLGEQIVPEEEDEGFGRQALRFGAEVATDPLNLLFGTGVGRKVVGAGLRKAVTPALSAAGEKLGTTAFGGALARFSVPHSKIATMIAPKAGKKIAQPGNAADEAILVRLGKLEADFEDVFRKSGLHKASAAEKREMISDFLEGTPVKGVSRETADWMRKQLDDVADEAERLGLQMWDSAREKFVPFERIENYVPRMFKRGAQADIDKFRAQLGENTAENIAILSQPRTGKFARSLAKKLNVSEEKARQILREEAVRPRKVGHLEFRRRHMPKELEGFLERDPAAWFTRYMERVIPRIEYAKRFGNRYEVLGKHLQEVVEEAIERGIPRHTAQRIADDIAGVIKGETAVSYFGQGGGDVLRGALAIQTLGKLGPTTSVLNWGQTINDAVKEGIGKTLRSIGLRHTPSVRQKHIPAYLGGLREHLRMMTGQGDPRSLPARLAQGWLRVVGFTPIERTNRVGSSIAGVLGARDTATRLARVQERLMKAAKGTKEATKLRDEAKKLSDKLRNYGVKSVKRATERARLDGTLPPAMERVVGMRASQIAQHPTTAWQLPPAWRTPEMRLFFQFKRFAYNQTNFLYQQVAKPAYKWLETNGAQGDIRPFIRALALYPPAGMAIGTGREAVRDLQAWALGTKRRSYQDFNKHPTATVLRNMMYVGSFGMMADVLERAYRGGTAEYLLGPTVSDAMELIEETTRAGYNLAAEGELPTLEDMLLQVYGAVGRGALGVSPSELKKASTRRGLPGLVRETLE